MPDPSGQQRIVASRCCRSTLGAVVVGSGSADDSTTPRIVTAAGVVIAGLADSPRHGKTPQLPATEPNRDAVAISRR
jgi:hypothetical protein